MLPLSPAFFLLELFDMKRFGIRLDNCAAQLQGIALLKPSLPKFESKALFKRDPIDRF